jgi:hypothetical protein
MTLRALAYFGFIFGISMGAAAHAQQDGLDEKAIVAFLQFSPKTELGKEYQLQLKKGLDKGDKRSAILIQAVGDLLEVASQSAKKSRENVAKVEENALMCVELWLTRYGAKMHPSMVQISHDHMKQILNRELPELAEHDISVTLYGLRSGLESKVEIPWLDFFVGGGSIAQKLNADSANNKRLRSPTMGQLLLEQIKPIK